MRLIRDGYDSPHTRYDFFMIPIYGFDAVGRPGQYTLMMETLYADEIHCISFDFGPEHLAAILRALPAHVSCDIRSRLDREPTAPKQLNFSHPILCESITATLGEQQHGPHESFVPMLVREMNIAATGAR
ncbi:MAG: hypothetical protein OXE50_15460 [Chloroflexi bacterium]|nr:hypothetical protein [Chloroflexota bacterium]